MDRRGKRCPVRRVVRMERCFHILRARDPVEVRCDPELRRMLEALTDYYENGHGVEKDLEMAAQKYLEGYRYGSQECKAGYLRCKSLTEAQEK